MRTALGLMVLLAVGCSTDPAREMVRANDNVRSNVASAMRTAAELTGLHIAAEKTAMTSRDDVFVSVAPTTRSLDDLDMLAYWSAPNTACAAALPEGFYHIVVKEGEGGARSTATFRDMEGRDVLTLTADMELMRPDHPMELGVGSGVAGSSVQFKKWTAHSPQEHWITTITIETIGPV